ncbi:MAG TPA: hypothetical protein PLG87_02270 [Treponemataceae bacterium]|jgi:hypothetical protein|nr:hypothetical protein [Treponemataceae bacterium]
MNDKEKEIIPFLGIGKLTFHTEREEIFSILGKPSVHINELVMPRIMIYRFSTQGIQIYYDLDKENFPFAIEISKQYGGQYLGKNLFGKSLEKIKFSINKTLIDRKMFDSVWEITEDSLWFNFTEKGKLFSITVFREGYLNFISEKKACNRPTVSLSGAEREKKYGRYYRFE